MVFKDHVPVPHFETQRLIIRPPTLQDAPGYAKHFVDFEVVAGLSGDVPWPYPPDGVVTYFEKSVFPELGKKRWTWLLCLKSRDQEIIGSVDLIKPGTPGNRGGWLARRFWGKGLMSEAHVKINEFAFNTLHFDKIVSEIAAGNDKMRKLAQKSGSVFSYTQPKKFVDSKYTMNEVWELHRETWLKQQEEAA